MQQVPLKSPEKEVLIEEINTWIEKIQGLTGENKAILSKILQNRPGEITVKQCNEAMQGLGMDVSKTECGFMVKAVKGSFTFSYHPSHKKSKSGRSFMRCVNPVKKFFENLGIHHGVLMTLERVPPILLAKKTKRKSKKKPS